MTVQQIALPRSPANQNPLAALKQRLCTQLIGTDLCDFRLIISASCYYQPITAILYTSRTGTVASVIQAAILWRRKK